MRSEEIITAANKTMAGGGGLAVFGGLTTTHWMSILGFLVALIGLVVSIQYQAHRKRIDLEMLRMRKIEHRKIMEANQNYDNEI